MMVLSLKRQVEPCLKLWWMEKIKVTRKASVILEETCELFLSCFFFGEVGDFHADSADW